MPIPICLLVLEDEPIDAELVLRELRRAGFEPLSRRVDTEADFLAALETGYAPGRPWELVLADFQLPQFTGVRALQLLRARGVDLPFILVSGTIGEDVAVEAMQAGADDYLLKDRLTRLGPAVTRALEERQLRAAKRQAEENYSRLFENSLAGIYQLTPDGQLLAANPALARMLGYDSPADLIASLSALARQSYVDPGRRAEFIRQMVEREVIAGFESELYRQDGSTIWVSENARAVRDAHGTLLYYEGIIEDITARKLSEEALRRSEQRYRTVSELASDFAYAVRVEPDGALVAEWVTEAFTRLTGFTLSEVDLAGGWPSILHPDDTPVFLGRMQSLLSGRSDVSEYRTLTKGGEVRWLSDSGRPVWDDVEQRVIRIYGAAQDITERKRAEEVMAQSERRFRALIENSSDGIALLAADGTVLYTSTAAARIVGGTPAEWLGGNFLNRVHPEDADRLASLLVELVQTPGARLASEFRYRRRDESWCWLEATATNLLAEPAVNAIVANYRDITERRQAEYALKASEARFGALFRASPAAITLTTLAEGRFVDVNASFERLMGYSRDEVIGRTVADVPTWAVPEQRASIVAALRERGSLHTLELSFRRRSGEIMESLTSLELVELGGERYILGLSIDITERKQAEVALARERELLRTLIDNIPDLIYAKDSASRFTLANRASASSLGRTPEDVVGRTDFDLHPPEHAAQFFADEQAVMQSDQAHIGREEMVFIDGQERWLLTTTVPLHDGAGNVTGLVGISRDITQRRQSEAALLRSQKQLEAVLASVGEGIIVINAASRIIMVNDAAGKIWGYAPHSLAGTPLPLLMPESYRAQHAAGLQRYLQTGIGRVIGRQLELEGLRQDGTVFPLELRIAETRLGDELLFTAAVRDITDRKQAEAAIRQSQNDLETAQALAHLGSWSRDASSNLTLWSKELFRLHYLSPAVAAPSFEAYIETIHPDDRQILIDQLKAVEQEVDQATCLYRTNPTLGPDRVLEAQLHALRDDSGQVSGWQGTVQDVTQRKQRERELDAVATVSAALRTAQTLDEMLPIWLDVTLALIHASGGSIWLHDAARDELRPAVLRGWTQPAGDGPVRPQKSSEGVNGYVFVTGQPYVAADFKQDPHLAAGVRERIPPGGGAGIPIRVKDQVIGTFVVNLPPGREVNASDVHLLTTLADIAGSAIHRMQLHEQTEQRLSQLTALREVDRAIMGSLDLRLTLEILLEQVTTRLGVDAASVLLYDKTTATLNFAAGRGFRSRKMQQTRFRLGESYAGRAGLERRIVQASDLHEPGTDFQRSPVLAAEEFVSYVGAPLITKGLLRGVLEVFHRALLAPDAGWTSFLEALAGQAAIAVDNATLFDSLQRSNTDLELAYDATIEGWSRALDLRDRETEGHSQRVTRLTELLAHKMGVREAELVHVRRGALLHDIGKMGVPDQILLKPGPLGDDEWATMRQHPRFAYEMISPIGYLQLALDIPYGHHEKWDGSGYPRGLAGEAIPLAARIFAVVDVWDALRSDRPYRRAWPAGRVREYIREQAGKHFDPAVVAAFLEMDLPDSF